LARSPAVIPASTSTHQQQSSFEQASIKQTASTQHRASSKQVSSKLQAVCTKQPITKSLSESGFIPAQKTAAPLLAKTSDGPPTIE
jgi:hypothetical protein